MGRPSTTEQKLDMALDDLVDRKSAEDRSSKGYGPAGRPRDRDGPYPASGDAKGKGDGKGKGKGKRKLPLEEKSLLHTQCFFNPAGELVVKLYDTQVFVLRKRPEEKKEEKAEKEGAESKGLSAEKSQSELVLTLTSGGFRTAETRSILNEALQPMALKINGSDSQSWTLCSDYKTPGQVTTESSSKPFEDGMEVSVPSLVTPSGVKDHMAGRIQAARAAADAARSQPSPGYPPPGPAHLPPPGWPGAPLHPHPHWGMPPPGWGPPPPHGWRPLHHPPPPHAWAGHPPPAWGHPPPGAHPPRGVYGPPNGKGAPGKGHPLAAPPGQLGQTGARPPVPVKPAGPVSDDMFQ